MAGNSSYTRRITKQHAPHARQVLPAFFSQISNTPLLEYRAKFAALHRRLFPPQGPAMLPANALNHIDYRTWIEEKLK